MTLNEQQTYLDNCRVDKIVKTHNNKYLKLCVKYGKFYLTQ